MARYDWGGSPISTDNINVPLMTPVQRLLVWVQTCLSGRMRQVGSLITPRWKTYSRGEARGTLSDLAGVLTN